MKYILTVIFFFHSHPYLGEYTIAYSSQENCLASMSDLNQWAEKVNTESAKTFFACPTEYDYNTLASKMQTVH